MALAPYNQKRDFKKTSEPAGSKMAAKADTSRFVIQKHIASHLHYDFRLEIEGVLKSWAVPKGPPFAKGEKRLALEVEDHPISYLKFEGTIPRGQYGGGTVMVWDIGTFESMSKAPLKELAGGKLHFVLQGKKLKGEWYLVRTRRGEGKNQWLLIKGGEDMKPVSAKGDDTSALSGKNMKAIEKGKVWNSNHAGDPEGLPYKQGAAKAKAVQEDKEPRPKRIPIKNKTGKVLPFFEPMMAKLLKSPPTGDWTYEIKFDGYRALAFMGPDGDVKLLSRNCKNLALKFPEVMDSLGKLKTANTVLDGEIVALGPNGQSSFQLLQRKELGLKQSPLVYYVFDLPQQEGEDLRALPLEDRRERLKKLFPKQVGVIRFSESVGSDGEKLLLQAKRLGLEGVIGKRGGSTYEAGQRSGAWVKLKTHREQEFVIGGYTEPEGGRHHFGALLMGVYAGKRLVFTGKVGTGYNEALLRALGTRFKGLAQERCPFINLPEAKTGRYGSGITKAEMKRCHWLKPTLVAQVKFAEWTQDGKLRQPVFLGLREDKKARDICREEPADGH